MCNRSSFFLPKINYSLEEFVLEIFFVILFLIFIIALIIEYWPFVLGALIIAGVIYALYRLGKRTSERPATPSDTDSEQLSKITSTDDSTEIAVSDLPAPAADTSEVTSQDFQAEQAPTTLSDVTPIAPVSPRPQPRLHHLRRNLTDFVVFDIETTGFSRTDDHIIQLSAIKYRSDQQVATFNSFINPHTALSQKISLLTGITDADLVDAPENDEVITNFTTFIEDLPMIGHYIFGFDLPFLMAKGFYRPDIFALDTLPLARKKMPDLPNHKLPTLKSYFAIHNRSHNSLNDCETNAIVYQHLRDNHLTAITDNRKFPQTLVGQRFCITGEFMEADRDEVIEDITTHGGRYTKSVSGLTDYLICGTQTSSRLTDGIHSNSELKALSLANDGGKIKLISYDDFQQLLAPVAASN